MDGVFGGSLYAVAWLRRTAVPNICSIAAPSLGWTPSGPLLHGGVDDCKYVGNDVHGHLPGCLEQGFSQAVS